MKIVSWNINGLRAAIKNGFVEKVLQMDADIVGLQEIRIDAAQIKKLDLTNLRQKYPYQLFNTGNVPGYSGTAIFSKYPIENPVTNFELDMANNEGRICYAEINKQPFLVGYIPNAGGDLARLPFRVDVWDPFFRNLVKSLPDTTLVMGDMNVAPSTLDIHTNCQATPSAGFTPQERESFKEWERQDVVDIFRTQNPSNIQYTWWSYRQQSRLKNIGWRIDHAYVNRKYANHWIVQNLSHVTGSDHAPIMAVRSSKS